MDDCCGGGDCDTVCPRHPDFAARYDEVGGFGFPSLERLHRQSRTTMPRVIPVIYHPHRRDIPLDVEAAAFPLFKLISRTDGALHHQTPDALRDAFRVARSADIYLTGVDRDAPLERWWEIGKTRRKETTQRLADLDILGVSVPNYSTFRDTPRSDALHALARIAIVFEEMRSTGINAALHLNGSTERDYERLALWIGTSQAVTHVAADFGTGSKRRSRGQLHASLLRDLGRACGGRLHLVLRGGTQWLPLLVPAFQDVTILDTSSFCKTMWRRRAVPSGNDGVDWVSSPTELGQSLSGLLVRNIDIHGSLLREALSAARHAT